MAHRPIYQSPDRKFEQPNNFQAEVGWFSSLYLKPHGIADADRVEDLNGFKNIIWNNPARVLLPGYGCTPDELAQLCKEGQEGWIISSHISWLLESANRCQHTSVCLCMDVSSPEELGITIRRRNLTDIKQLILVANVGKMPDNSVYFSTPQQSGSHWVLVTVELSDHPRVLYCDSMAWGVPPNLLHQLARYTALFGLSRLSEANIQLMHTPTQPGHNHTCSEHCKNYPLQTCGHVCGIIATICAITAAMDPSLFGKLTGAKNGLNDSFLVDPTRYEKYLRRVMMYWFIHGLDMTLLHQSDSHASFDDDFEDFDFIEHSYCRKRKASNSEICEEAQSSYKGNPSSTHSQRQSNSQAEPSSPKMQDQNSQINTASSSTWTHNHGKCKNLRMEDHAKKDNGQVFYREMSAPHKLGTPAISNIHASPNQANNGTSDNEAHSKILSQGSQSNALSSDAPSHNSSRKFCPYCNKSYRTRQSLLQHKKEKHRQQHLEERSLSSFCHCNACDFKCQKLKDLIDHYNSQHGKNLTISTRIFATEDDFMMWKRKVEKHTSSLYVKHCGARTTKICIQNYFYCKRSGRQELLTERKRALKSQGSCKIGFHCTAFMISYKYIKNGTITVEYCLQHAHHISTSKLPHTKLSENLRLMIAGKLAQGVEIDTVFNVIRNKITDGDKDRLTRQDIDNFKKQFRNITETKRHSDDERSVDLWVQELQNDSGNPIILYKAQDTPFGVLQDEDFLLVIQTRYQRNMMKMYAHKIICIDSTQCTNQHDFQLTTILILDDSEAAVPVAWALSNREDADLLTVFFRSLLEACGQDIVTTVFMSDLEDNFYDAWCTVFTKPANRLYCSWHVDKNWREKIREMIPSQEEQCDVYSYLKVLQHETHKSKFRNILHASLTLFQDISPVFYNYFHTNYVQQDKFNLWAACYKKCSIASTNMLAEAFRVLKVVYLHKRQKKRLDKLLIILLRLTRGRTIEKLFKSEKGAASSQIKDMRSRHAKANDVKGIKKNDDDDGEWTVPSTIEGIVYLVKKVTDADESCHCEIKCNSCNVCVCMYECTCADFLTKTIACKHIHAAHMLNSEEDQADTLNQDNTDDETDFFKSAICQGRPERSDNLASVKMAALGKAGDIIQFLRDTEDLSVVQFACGQLQTIFNVGKGMEQNPAKKNLEKKRNTPNKKKFEHQQRLYSKKKKKSSKGN